MAKAKQTTEQDLGAPVPGTAVAVSKTADAPVAFLDELVGREGEGLSQAQEDNLVPLLYTLQALSPQVKPDDPARMPGAEMGDLLLKATGQLWKGKEGFVFQPCAFGKEWVEWVPRERGGGFVGRFPELPDDAVEYSDPKSPNIKRQKRGENELVETRYHFGNVFDDDGNLIGQMVIPLASTGHTFSRGWMMYMNGQRLPNGALAPSYTRAYRIQSQGKKNTKGSWYGLKYTDMGWVTIEQLRLGRNLHDAVAAGDKQAAAPDEQAQAAEAEASAAVGADEIPF